MTALPRLLRAALPLWLLAAATVVQAQAYPAKPITVINPWAAGGPAEAIIRPIAEKLQARLGQPVLVDSRGGANGTIGAAMVARAQPDGYTLLFSHVGPIAISPALPQKPPYDPVRDFVPITQIVSGPTVLVVRADNTAAKTLPELMAFAKANPGKVSYGSVGVGSTTHLAGATLAAKAGVDMVHVPYKGSAQINTDLLGGQITTAFVNIAGVLPLIQDGRLRALAVSTAKRAAVLPQVPAVAESYAGFDMNSWYGLMAPAKTPQAVIDKLHDEVVAILKLPEIANRLRELGADPEGTTPQAYAAKIRADLAAWGEAVKTADVRE